MSKRDDRISLQDMLNHVQEALTLSKTVTQEQFAANRVLQLAITRLLEIIGEAANRVTESTRTANPDVPWRQIIAMRNRLIHGYDVIDQNILWHTLVVDLPTLELSLVRILKSKSQ